MKKKRKKIPWQQVLGTVIAAGIGALIGFFIGGWLFETQKSLGETLLSALFLLFGLYLASYAQIILHEGGHLVCGLLSGYRFSSFRIGSFMWVKENGKLRLKRMSLKGTGGQCLMVPPEMEDGKIPYVLYNMGGPLANLVTTPLFALLAFVFRGVPAVFLAMVMLAGVGLVCALTNGIPLRMGIVDNDGYNARSLGKDPEALFSFWVQLTANEQLAKGTRLKDMPQEWFRVPSEEGMKNSMTAVLGVFACNRLMDEKEFEEADRLMEKLLKMDTAIVGLHRSMMIADQIFCELVGENRSERIAQLLDKPQKKFMKSMSKYPSILRTEYAYAMLGEGDKEKAEKIRAQFEKAVRTYPSAGDIESERELLDYAGSFAQKQ